MEKFDVIIIGGGPAGLVSSKLLKAFGKKVAIVEEALLGGDCTHSGCIPSKALLKCANVAYETKHISKYGLASNEIKIDTKNVLTHVRSIVAEIYSHETPEIFEKEGISIIQGRAHFISEDEIKVNDKIYCANKYIIATGSSAVIPTIKGIKSIPYLSNSNMFLQEKIPESLIIVGTGAIGIEMASAFNRLGSKVSLFSRSSRILKAYDEELSGILLKELRKEGISFFSNSKLLEVQKTLNGISLDYEKKGKHENIQAQKILFAIGRKANTNINFEKARVSCNENGIIVNECLQSTNKNIYAIGDVSSVYKYTHIAEQEAIKAATNIVLPIKQKISYEHVGSCIYAQPELAHIGLNKKEIENKYKKNEYSTYSFEYKNSDRGYTDVNKVGMIKVSVLNNGKILAASILGSRAGELIHQLQMAKTFDISFDKLSKMIYLYPTYADIIKQPAKKFYINKLLKNKALLLLKKILSVFKSKNNEN